MFMLFTDLMKLVQPKQVKNTINALNKMYLNALSITQRDYSYNSHIFK